MTEKEITATLGFAPVCTKCYKHMGWMHAGAGVPFLRCETWGCSQFAVECYPPTFVLRHRQESAEHNKEKHK